jgi:tRNA-2-methylthio-N6-dimethylallyladenosine synthase
LPSFYIETFGCQMNERDSETIGALLSEQGLTETRDPRVADVIVLNTCAVRETAENKVWSRLGRIASERQSEDMPIFVLAGCMAQVPGTVERIKKQVPYIRIVTGPGRLHEIPSLVEKASAEKAKGRNVPLFTALSPKRGPRRDQSTEILPEGLPRSSNPRISAYVTIMYGCDNFCSYCIVPYVRGPQVSREPEAILDEIKDLAHRGCKEIVLLGQNVNTFGMDLESKQTYHFSQLLDDVNKIDGILRVRYYTSHPRDFSSDMVRAVRDNDKVCEHFHLPLQSGSDRILKLMNRGYTRQRYLELVDYIRSEIPGASITTDIIVGFPGETDDDFEDTLEMIRLCKFDGTFSFVYSPRTGTAAAKMGEQVDPKLKSKRLQRLVDVQAEVIRNYNQSLIGREIEILVEESQNGHVKGRARTNKVITGTGSATIGTLVKVKIKEAGVWYLRGEVVQ